LLLQNFPNPFNPETIISYQLPLDRNIELIIKNLFGQRIRTLIKGFQNAGYYQIPWDGRDDENNQVTSGIYIYQLNAGEFIQMKKMLMLK
jgi:flagellar hook assembly protein FlgD